MSMYKGDTTVCTLLLCTVHVVVSSGRMSCLIDNQKCMCNETENVCVSIITREDYRFFFHMYMYNVQGFGRFAQIYTVMYQ